MNRQRLLVPWLGLGLLVLAVPAVTRAQAPEYLGKSLSAWAHELNSKDPVARRSAAFALGKMGGRAGDHLTPLLKILRDDPVASVRQSAAHAIGEIARGNFRATDNPDLLPGLQAALAKDADSLVRRSAAVALGNLGSDAKQSQASLEQALADSRPEVRQNAAWALGRIGADTTRALKSTLTDPDPLMLREAARSLGLLGAKARAALPELLACCRHADVEVRKAAVETLVGLVGPKDTGACEPLRHALADPDREVRYNAALALGNIGGKEARAAVPVLIEAARQKTDLGLRRQAAAVLRNIGPDAEDALAPLREALKDADPQVRRNAAVSLGGLAEKAGPAYGDLLKLVVNPREDREVRMQAAVALSRIGAALSHIGPIPVVRDAAPKLIGVVKDASNPSEVRLRALWALRILQRDLKDYPQLFNALERILMGPRTKENRMLRYDAAFLLAFFQRGKVADAVLETLNDFLHDATVLIYVGVTTDGPGVKPEKKTKPGNVIEKGKGDGRVMAVQAVRYIGRDRIRAWPQWRGLVRQLRALQDSFDPRLRQNVKTLLDQLGD